MNTFQIPRMAMAVLVLGAACGEDESNDDPKREDGSLEDAASPSRTDSAAGESPDDTGSEPDAGQDRSDAGSGPTGGTDVSDQRLLDVAARFCATAFGCEAEEAMGVFDDEAACRTALEEFRREDLERHGEECADAQLDLYDCYASASCEEQFTACEAEADVAEEACPE